MRLSKYFLPLLKEAPSGASIKSHQLMLRAGMIRQVTSGIYNWLPLGLNVLKKVENIIRDEMNKAGAIEILMPAIQPADLWQKTGRYGEGGELDTEMLKMEDRHGNKLLFAPTAEEVVTTLFDQNIQSYKDLPKNIYQISWKFRDEIRPRFGIMRGREFFMKDAYSFDINKEDAVTSYKNMFAAYINIFKKMNLSAIPVAADTGDIGGDFSHEFHVLAETGESLIYAQKGLEDFIASKDFCFDKMNDFYTAEEDMHDLEKSGLSENEIISKRGIEVGHIFCLGDKYTKALDVKVQGQDGKPFNPIMGCYGIGVSRLLGAIIEAYHDEDGIKWPESVAPFKVALINLKAKDENCSNAADGIYRQLEERNIEVLYDDTKESAGAKFAKTDLIGIPWQLALGPRSLEEGNVELKNRHTGEKETISIEAAINKLTA